MQKRYLLASGFKQKKRIVFDRHVPEVSGGFAPSEFQVAKKPAREVDKVHSLVDRFSATRDCSVSPPFLFITRASSVSIPGSDKEQVLKHPRFKDLASLYERTMIPVIEANPYQRACSIRGLPYDIEFNRPARPRLFDEHVFAVRCRSLSDLRQQIMSGADNHDIDIVSRNSRSPVGADGGARNFSG